MPGNTEVQFQTQQGDFIIELFDDVPATVANFLFYVADDRYDGSFFHRLVKGFVLQGGGYTYDGTNTSTVPTVDPVPNEYDAAHPNLRGTIAMATVTGDPDSATDQFFFNLTDNSANLAGYTVFGAVIAGWNTVTAISKLRVFDFGSPFGELPVESSYSGHGGLAVNDVVGFHVEALGVANDDRAATGNASVVTGSLVTNDIDVDTPVLAIATVNGKAASVGGQTTLDSGALVTVNADGTFRYDPNHAFDALSSGESAVDSFSYTLVGGGTVSGSATARITVTRETAGGEHLVGTRGPDVLTGHGGNDLIEGLRGNDRLTGGGGADTLDGGPGKDSLTGGKGADRFVFESGDAGNRAKTADTITDFSPTQHDRIDLAAIDAIAATMKVDRFAFIGAAPFSGTAGELHYQFKGGDTLVSGDVDGDKAADFIVRLTGNIAPTADDFIGVDKAAAFVARNEATTHDLASFHMTTHTFWLTTTCLV